MRATGYTAERAAPHDRAAVRVSAELERRGYPVTMFDGPDGHRPDAELYSQEHLGDLIEIKTSNGKKNLAIEIDSINEYRRIEILEHRRVYIIWLRNETDQPSEWRVFTVDSLAPGISGPYRPTGLGSLDDWYLFRADLIRGEPFDDFFVGG